MKSLALIILAIFLASSFFLLARCEENTTLHHEITPELVFYSGDALRSSIDGGLQYALHFNRTWWVGIDFLGGTLSVDAPNGLGLSDGDRLIGLGSALYINLPAILGAGWVGDSGSLADLYTTIGGGHFWLGSEGEYFGFVGGGMLLHTPISHLAVRFDLKGYFFRLRNTAGTDFSSDMALSIGPSFLF